MTTIDSERTGCVYALIDPRNQEPKYVGATINPDQRIYGLKSAPPNRRLSKWFDELESNGLEPEFAVLERAAKSRLSELETRVIKEFDDLYDLFNVQKSSSSDHSNPRESAAPAAYSYGQDSAASPAGDR